jgi:hypothetical protein
MTLKWILLSERSQSWKATYWMIATMWHSRKGKLIKTVKRVLVAIGFGKRENKVTALRSSRPVKLFHIKL